MSNSIARIGEVYAHDIEQIDRWCACHVIADGYGDVGKAASQCTRADNECASG